MCEFFHSQVTLHVKILIVRVKRCAVFFCTNFLRVNYNKNLQKLCQKYRLQGTTSQSICKLNNPSTTRALNTTIKVDARVLINRLTWVGE